ncbi:MAG: hypothetical protein AAB618_00255 [Patescibacteria group bacterium]
MEFAEGPFLKLDEKRLKKIKSLKLDVKAHHKFLVGKFWELRNSPRFHVPTSKTVLLEEVDETGGRVQVCKFRQVTTKPKSDKSGGLRIIAAIFFGKDGPVRYVPILVYLAKEEGTSIAFNGKNYKLEKSGIISLFKARLESAAI